MLKPYRDIIVVHKLHHYGALEQKQKRVNSIISNLETDVNGIDVKDT